MRRTNALTNLSAAVIALLLPVASRAADLKPEAVNAWQEYIGEKKAAAKSRGDGPLMFANDSHDWAALRSGKVIIAPAGPNVPKRVPSGLIHDWIGAAFIPNATIPQVLAAVRDYDRYKDVYNPSVIDSKLCSTTEDEDRFWLLLMNKSLFVKKALEGDYRASYFRLDDRRWYSIAESTRIREIEGYGESDARLLPEGQGAGLIWRAESITRYEVREGGVLVHFEAMVLSRDIPGALRFMVDPIVRRVSREALELSLRQTRDAVQSNLARAEPSIPAERQTARPASGTLSFR